MHDNYGPVTWGGTGERWDLLQLTKGGRATGGEWWHQRAGYDGGRTNSA